MPAVKAYACDDEQAVFHPITLEVREPGPGEIYFEVKYAGICHSDIHTARGEWVPASYPLVPGHEIVGVVAAVGDGVTKFSVGDTVGVGCLVGSCRSCEFCQADEEQYCNNPHAYWTYGKDADGEPTAGGYAQGFTVREDFALRIPEGIPLEQAAPLLCAGITTYSPLKRWGAKAGKQVAIVGMGGLGHMAVQFAAALGAEVSVISQGHSKEEDAKRFGAHHFYALSDEGVLAGLQSHFDLIICTVSSNELDYSGLIKTLKPFGSFVDVGLPQEAATVDLSSLVHGGRVVAGSLIGGIAETQRMLEFCAAHEIYPQVEIIDGERITQAYDDVVASRVRYRYVIDTSTF